MEGGKKEGSGYLFPRLPPYKPWVGSGYKPLLRPPLQWGGPSPIAAALQILEISPSPSPFSLGMVIASASPNFSQYKRELRCGDL